LKGGSMTAFDLLALGWVVGVVSMLAAMLGR
jgi:hypothetical protein